MVLVVDVMTKKILNRCDAWQQDSVGVMKNWADKNGYVVLDTEITFMGDMVIWVE